MPEKVPRRRLLRWTGIALLAGAAGCVSGTAPADAPSSTPTSSPPTTAAIRSPTEETPTRTPTEETPTRTPTKETPTPALTDLGFSASVVGQPSADAAGKVAVRLHNPAATETEVRVGQSILYSGAASPAGLQHAGGINLVHEDTLGSVDRIDGCRRYPRSSVTPTARPYRAPIVIPPESAVEDRYGVVTSPSADACLPAGEYRFENEIVRGGYEGPVIALTVTIADDRKLSVATSGPTDATS